MILIAVGSNLSTETYGSPLKNCLKSVILLRRNFFVNKVSKFYKTEPIPKSNQPWYVNGVVEIKTNLYPLDVLKKLFSIENHFKRIRKRKNEPRTIDLDLISYNRLIFKNNSLTLPHPRMHKRMFVIKPLCDINQKWEHPIFKDKAVNLLKKLANQKIFNIT